MLSISKAKKTTKDMFTKDSTIESVDIETVIGEVRFFRNGVMMMKEDLI